MNVNEYASDNRFRVLSVLTVVWLSLFIAMVIFFPVLAVVPEGPIYKSLLTIFLVVVAAMLSLAAITTLMSAKGYITIPNAPEVDYLRWPFVLAGVLIFACMISGTVVGNYDTADRLGTGAALLQVFSIIGLCLIPFVVLGIAAPLFIQRYSSDYAQKARKWGYGAAFLIDFGLWLYLAGLSPSFLLEDWAGYALILVVYLVYLAVRRRRRNMQG